jgi:hypothetical protein
VTACVPKLLTLSGADVFSHHLEFDMDVRQGLMNLATFNGVVFGDHAMPRKQVFQSAIELLLLFAVRSIVRHDEPAALGRLRDLGI